MAKFSEWWNGESTLGDFVTELPASRSAVEEQPDNVAPPAPVHSSEAQTGPDQAYDLAVPQNSKAASMPSETPAPPRAPSTATDTTSDIPPAEIATHSALAEPSFDGGQAGDTQAMAAAKTARDSLAPEEHSFNNSEKQDGSRKLDVPPSPSKKDTLTEGSNRDRASSSRIHTQLLTSGRISLKKAPGRSTDQDKTDNQLTDIQLMARKLALIRGVVESSTLGSAVGSDIAGVDPIEDPRDKKVAPPNGKSVKGKTRPTSKDKSKGKPDKENSNPNHQKPRRLQPTQTDTGAPDRATQMSLFCIRIDQRAVTHLKLKYPAGQSQSQDADDCDFSDDDDVTQSKKPQQGASPGNTR